MKEVILKAIEKQGIIATVDEFNENFQIVGKTLEVGRLYDDLKADGFNVEKSGMYLGTMYVYK